MEDLDKIEARYPDNDPIDNDVRALIVELRQTRLQVDGLRKLVQGQAERVYAIAQEFQKGSVEREEMLKI